MNLILFPSFKKKKREKKQGNVLFDLDSMHHLDLPDLGGCSPEVGCAPSRLPATPTTHPISRWSHLIGQPPVGKSHGYPVEPVFFLFSFFCQRGTSVFRWCQDYRFAHPLPLPRHGRWRASKERDALPLTQGRGRAGGQRDREHGRKDVGGGAAWRGGRGGNVCECVSHEWPRVDHDVCKTSEEGSVGGGGDAGGDDGGGGQIGRAHV